MCSSCWVTRRMRTGIRARRQLARVTEAVHEYERGAAPRILFTGGAVHNRFVEAQVMARTAEAQGIPASAVLEDPAARDTMENTCNALKIMRSHGWESAEVISSPSHLPRAGLILSRLPMKWRVDAAPALGPAGAGADGGADRDRNPEDSALSGVVAADGAVRRERTVNE